MDRNPLLILDPICPKPFEDVHYTTDSHLKEMSFDDKKKMLQDLFQGKDFNGKRHGIYIKKTGSKEWPWLYTVKGILGVTFSERLYVKVNLADEQIVELGKWLAANQAVTGRLAVLGSSYILQAKRTDIRTMGTMGLGSMRCAAGQEDELLKGMPGLARKLAGLKSNF